MCGLGGVLSNPSGEAVEFFSACLSHEEVCALGGDVKKSIIFEAELLALIVAIHVWSSALEGQLSVFYVNNNSARDVAVSGSARSETGSALVSILLKIEDRISLFPWYARVAPPSNPADRPSRGATGHLKSLGVKEACCKSVFENHSTNRIRWGLRVNKLCEYLPR